MAAKHQEDDDAGDDAGEECVDHDGGVGKAGKAALIHGADDNGALRGEWRESASEHACDADQGHHERVVAHLYRDGDRQRGDNG